MDRQRILRRLVVDHAAQIRKLQTAMERLETKNRELEQFVLQYIPSISRRTRVLENKTPDPWVTVQLDRPITRTNRCPRGHGSMCQCSDHGI